jgi:tetratricopeptide (TPR) repeat protein
MGVIRAPDRGRTMSADVHKDDEEGPMPGWLRRPGGELSARDRLDRLRERIGRLRADGITAQLELEQRYGNPMAAPETARPRLLAQMLQDERMPRAARPVRERAGRLWDEVESLRAKPEPEEREIVALEAAFATFEGQFAPLRAWFLTRAAVTLGPVDLRLASPFRETLTRSLAVDRDLLPTPELIVRCDFLIKAGEEKTALKDAEAAARRPDADHRAFTVHAATLRLAGRELDAAEAFRRAFEASPGRDVGLLVQAGNSLLLTGRHQDALEAADAVLDADPSNLPALRLRADALRFLTRFEEAEAAYRSLLERPDTPDVQVGLLQVLVGLGRAEEVDQLLETLRNDPKASRARLAIALSLSNHSGEAAAGLRPGARHQFERLQTSFDCSIGCPEHALGALGRLLAQDPSDADLEDCRSVALSALGRLDEAIASSRRSKTLIDKSEFDATLARALRWSGDAAGALPYARHSHDARPRRTEGIAELVCCLLQMGRPEEARALVDCLPAEAGRDPYAMYARATLAHADGDPDEARRLLAVAAEISREFELRAVIDPVFHNGEALDDSRRSMLRALIEANALRRVTLVDGAPPPLQQGDRMVIQTLAQRADLDTPREVSHWLYFPDRRSAEDAADALRSDGYAVTVDKSRGDSDGRWCTKALRRIVVSPATIATTRASMERLAARLGGEYDGWEAEVNP